MESLAVPPDRLYLLRDPAALKVVGFVVRSYWRKLPRRVVANRDDLKGWALRGLADAALRYDKGTGYRFSTFARRRIMGAIQDELRALDWVPKSVRRIDAAARVVAQGRANAGDDAAAVPVLPKTHTGGVLVDMTEDAGDGGDPKHSLTQRATLTCADGHERADLSDPAPAVEHRDLVAWVLSQMPAGQAELLRAYYLSPEHPRLDDLQASLGVRTTGGVSLALGVAREQARRLLVLRFGADLDLAGRRPLRKAV